MLKIYTPPLISKAKTDYQNTEQFIDRKTSEILHKQ